MPTSSSQRGSPEAELVRLVFELAETLRHRYESIAEQHSLTRQQATLLGLLEHPHTMSSLAELVQRDASNITGLVDRLERDGLVQRERDTADRRVTLVSLTPAGRRLHGRFERQLYGSGLPFTSIDAEERTALLALLRRIVP